MNEQEEHINHNEKAEKRIVEDVEKYGFHKALLLDDGYLPAFAYSIGLYKTYQHPEIIIFGLSTDIMSYLLDKVGEEINKGVKFSTRIDYDEYLANYPIRFIEVDKEHYHDYLGYCGWFYDNTFDFPTYQLVWTDKERKYPWDKNFNENWKFKQPLLDRNVDFKFYEERNLGVFTTQKTLEGNPILWVYHNKDGAWQFHSEEYSEVENAKVVCLEDLVKKDQSLNEVYYLNYGQYAIRKDVNSKWEIFNDEEE